MPSQRCPQCNLVNFADAYACKRCNFQFQSQAVPTTPYNQPYNQYQQGAAAGTYGYASPSKAPPVRSESSGSGGRRMVVGALWAIGGTIATVLSYNAASGGGRYFIFWGAIIFGGIDFVRGFFEWIGGD
ncbi:MAG: hypothetical protein JSS81_11750 [Acidobacteria bacterium]|nr:hypothetical protein [Acidobacteriota bacterium]